MKVNAHEAKRILDPVDNSEKFRVKDGSELSRIKHLRDALNNMNVSVFEHHVREHENDFAEWVEHSVKDPDLAEVLRHVHSQDSARFAVEGRVHGLHKVLKKDWVAKKFAKWELVDFGLGLIVGMGVTAILLML